MRIFNLNSKNRKSILALGAESAGNFSVYSKNKLYFSEDFGDLLDDKNWRKYNSELNKFLRKSKIKPEIILTDLHPLYKTTLLGQKLAKKYRARHIQVQHHIAHIFSAIGEQKILDTRYQIPDTVFGIALDGTGYGLDGNIWGGEVFKISKSQTERIGRLENQTMIGGDLAVKEPARMLISILSKFLPKDEAYKQIKKFYTRNQFEVLHNQLQSGFNCQETSSTGRILDAVSVLLGFSRNERNFKHEPALLLEQNSTLPYRDLKSKIKKGDTYELDTTYLFKYLFKYLHRNKKRLAATAQLYIAQGFYEITKKLRATNYKLYLSGGIANNKIISDYLISKGAVVYPVKSVKGGAKQFNGVNQKIPRGDAGISFGQIIYFISK